MGPAQVPARVGARQVPSSRATPVAEGGVAKGREAGRGRLKDVTERSPAKETEVAVMGAAVAAAATMVAEAVRGPRDAHHAVAHTDEVGPSCVASSRPRVGGPTRRLRA